MAKFVVCSNCGEKIDAELFPVCPFCLTPVEETVKDDVKSDGVIEETIATVFNSDKKKPYYSATFFSVEDDLKDVNDQELLVSKTETDVADNRLNETPLFSMDEKSALYFNYTLSTRCMNFLRKNNINTTKQLRDFILNNDLTKIKNIGRKTISEILDLAKIDEVSFYKSNSSESQKLFFPYIDAQLKELDVSLLNGLGISTKTIGKLYEAGYTKIGMLQNISESNLSRIVRGYNVGKFADIENKLCMNLIELFGNILQSQSSSDEYMLTLFRADGLTLQEIGDLKGVTRERVRQIVNNYVDFLGLFLKWIVDFFLEGKGYVTVEELLGIYENDDFDKLIIYWCKNSEGLSFLPYADVFVPKQIDNNIEKKLSELGEELVGDGIKISDHMDKFEEILNKLNLPYINADNLINYLQMSGYRMYGDYIVKGRRSYGYLCSKIIADRFPDGIKLYDHHDMELLREYVLKEFGDIGLSDNDRALSARLSSFLIIRGRGMAIAKENIYVEPGLLEEIKSYIDSTNSKTIYYSELFSRFEGMIKMMSNIDNYNFLHGVINLYYPDEYIYTSKDYITKREGELLNDSFSDKIRRYIIETGCPLTRQEIQKGVPGMSTIMFFLAVSVDKRIIQWNWDQYYVIDLININESNKEHMLEAINTLTVANDGYCSANMLYSYVLAKYPEDLKELHVIDKDNLFCLSDYMFNNSYTFTYPHICAKGKYAEMSVKRVALDMMHNPKRLKYSVYQEISNRFMWSTTMTSIVFKDIEKDYIRVSLDEYVAKDSFSIKSETIDKIRELLKTHLQNGYLSLI
ncbi:MAG: hypothetical protein IJM79_02345, partial [Erysipelotrichaceae bacterium]|nr:hypothetical protein [Erysipelotrichaceae bacterium]